MIDDAPDLFQTITRRRPRALPSLSLNMAAFAERLDDLSLLEEAAFWRLYRSYWRNGELPRDPARLAAICKVTPQRWKRMAVAMERVFDVDESGRLRDLDLEEQRSAAVSKSEKNRQSARERWGASGDAFAYANASAETGFRPGRGDANGDASAVVPFSRGREDRRRGSLDEPLQSTSSSLSTEPSADAPADALASVEAAETSVDADANASAPAPIRSISHTDLADLLRVACKGKVTGPGLRPNGFRKIRVMMAEGYDLHGEILPALAANIDMVDELKHFGSAFVRDWVDEFRAERGKKGSARPAPADAKTFVAEGSPAWKAHEAARRASGDRRKMQSYFSKEHNCNGWLFDTEYPNIAPFAPTTDDLGPAKGAAPSVGHFRPSAVRDQGLG